MSQPSAPARTGRAYAYVTSLFFAWGFVTALIDPLIAAVRRVFDLSLAEAMLTASAWFLAYGVASIPAAWLLSRSGYGRSILAALLAMAAGGFIIPLATLVDSYGLILAGLFVIACGVTLLQVAANPLAAALGPPAQSHLRLTFAQAFNALGATLGPVIGSTILLTGGVFAADAVITPETRDGSLRAIDLAFLGVAGAVLVVAAMIWSVRALIDKSLRARPREAVAPLAGLRDPWARFGALAIFAYVGAEVTIGGLLIPFISSGSGLDLPAREAGHLVGLIYWGGAMVGRFVGSALLLRVRAAVLLLICAVAAAALAMAANRLAGPPAAYAALLIGLFNSIMFPTIFSLALERAKAPSEAVAGLLTLGIVGGACLPPLAGLLADQTGDLTAAFAVPIAAYGVVIAFAGLARRPRPA